MKKTYTVVIEKINDIEETVDIETNEKDVEEIEHIKKGADYKEVSKNETSEKKDKIIIRILNKIRLCIGNYGNKTFISGLANLVTIFGIFSLIWGGMTILHRSSTSYESRVLNTNIQQLKLEQNLNYVETILGKPNIAKKIIYTSYEGSNGTELTGYKHIYYISKNILICYFDTENKLFGYVVISGNKYFKPQIPYTNSRLLINKIVSIAPENSYKDKLKCDLFAYTFFSRTDDSYIEKYYSEIYDLNGMGFLGYGVTNLPNTLDNRYDKTFEKLSELSYNPNPFYKEMSEAFSNQNFYTDEKAYIDQINDGNYFDKVRGEEVNTYFLFTSSSDIDTKEFIKNELEKNYFMMAINLIQQN